MGTSFGCTQELFNFWHKNGYKPVYLRLTSNNLTGEHSCIMVKPHQGVSLDTIPNEDWLTAFHTDFKRRFINLLSYQFKSFPSALPLSFVFDPNANKKTYAVKLNEVTQLFTEFDLKRLESYARNLVDYHMILDLIPICARLLFLNRLDLSVSYTQAAIILAIGLQHKSVTDIEKELGIGSQQVLALFNKAVRKISSYLRSLQETEIRKGLESETPSKKKEGSKKTQKSMAPLTQSLEQEMESNTKEVNKMMKKKQQKLLEGMDLQRYAIGGSEENWSKALKSGKVPKSISVKADKGKEAPVGKYENVKKVSKKKGKKRKVLSRA